MAYTITDCTTRWPAQCGHEWMDCPLAAEYRLYWMIWQSQMDEALERETYEFLLQKRELDRASAVAA